MKNKIILVGGYCATGKSTFSRNLSQQLNTPCFNKDTIKEVMGDGFGPESGEVFEKGSRVTFLLMLHIAECFLRAGQICILESNFKMYEIEEIKTLLGKYNSECLTFVFKSDLDIVFDRYFERDHSGERHWVHMSWGALKESGKDGFKNGMAEKFGLEKMQFGQKINVDATDFKNVDYDGLYDIAKKFKEN